MENEATYIGSIYIPLIKGSQGQQGIAGKIVGLSVEMLPTTSTATIENYGTQQNAKIKLGIPSPTSISEIEIDDDELVITMSDGTILNLGAVVGSSVSSIYFTEDYDLMVELTDGTEINAGNIENLLNTILSNYYTQAEADALFSTIDETGNKIDLSINSSTYVMTLNLKDKNNNILSTGTIDLPLESVVVSGSYDSVNKKIILTLQNGSTVEFSVADLVSGLQTEITNANKLSADLVDDTSTTHKFVTASDKTTWNGKYAKPSGGIPKTDLASAVQTSLEKADTALQEHQDISGKEDNSNKVTSIDENSTDTQYPSAKLLYEELQEKQEEIDTLHSWLDQTTDTEEGEGTEITLENTLELPLKNITEEGNSEQESTEGNQLWVPYNYTGTSHSINWEFSTNGTITANGTADGNSYSSNKSVALAYKFKLPAGTYTLSGARSNIVIQIIDENEENVTSTSSSVTFTINEDKNVQLRAYIPSGTTLNETIKPMLNTGSTALPWEPYTNGKAPNPSYPFPIKNVTGNNNVVVSGKNILNLDTTNVIYNNQASDIAENGENVSFKAGATNTFIIYDLGLIENYRGKTLTFSIGEAQSKYASSRFINLDANGGNRNNIGDNSLIDNKYSRVTINETYTQTHLGIRLYVASATLGDTYTFIKPMVEIGDTPTTFEEYKTPQTLLLNLGNIELNGINTYKDLIFKAVNGNSFYDSLTAEQKALLTYGKWYKHENISKIRLPNTVGNYDSVSGTYYYQNLSTQLNISAKATIGLVNYFQQVSTYDFEHDFPDAFAFNEAKTHILIRNKALTSQAEYRNWLGQNTVMFYYIRETATDIEITDTDLIAQLEDIDKMLGYNGTTIITSTYEEGNAQMIIKATAYANKVTDTRLNSIEARLALLEE